jgi:hypothetical protein
MRIFLTGSQDAEWRWNLEGFFQEYEIDFFDSNEYAPEFSSVFKRLKILEGCDGVIACCPKHDRRHLQTVLELSYASKLAKQILLVDSLRRRKSWIHTLPYSLNFPTLDGLKEHLTKMVSSPKRSTLFWG